MTDYTPMEIKAARIMCKQHATICGTDEHDVWTFYSEDFKEDARLVLSQCGASELLEAAKLAAEINPYGSVENAFARDAARAAIAKATGVKA